MFLVFLPGYFYSPIRGDLIVLQCHHYGLFSLPFSGGNHSCDNICIFSYIHSPVRGDLIVRSSVYNKMFCCISDHHNKLCQEQTELKHIYQDSCISVYMIGNYGILLYLHLKADYHYTIHNPFNSYLYIG